MNVFTQGFALPNGVDLTKMNSLRGLNAANGLIAAADGTRASATALANGLNEVATVAGAADSVILPLAQAGAIVLVRNSGGADMQVFAQGTDTINSTAGAAGVSQATVTSAIYFCPINGSWFRVLSA